MFSRHYSYIRSKGAIGQSTRLMDCKEEYEKMSSQEKTRKIKDVRGCTQCTSWKHKASACRQKFTPESIVQTSNETCQPVRTENSTGFPAFVSQGPAKSEPKSLFVIYEATMDPSDHSIPIQP